MSLEQAERVQSPILFYDGSCALCHGLVRFVLRHDHSRQGIRIAALQGETAGRLLRSQHQDLPDSVVVLTPAGSVLTRSDAVIHVLQVMGGGWRVLADVLGLVSRPLRDQGYAAVAKMRRRRSGSRETACPLLPPHLRGRFMP